MGTSLKTHTHTHTHTRTTARTHARTHTTHTTMATVMQTTTTTTTTEVPGSKRHFWDREPLLSLRRVLWIVLGGWMFFLVFFFVGVAFASPLSACPWPTSSSSSLASSFCPSATAPSHAAEGPRTR